MGNENGKNSLEDHIPHKDTTTGEPEREVAISNGHVPRSILRRVSKDKGDESSLESDSSAVRSVIFVDQVESIKTERLKNQFPAESTNGHIPREENSHIPELRYSYEPLDATENRSSFLVERSKAYLNSPSISNHQNSAPQDAVRRTKRLAPQPPSMDSVRHLSTISEDHLPDLNENKSEHINNVSTQNYPVNPDLVSRGSVTAGYTESHKPRSTHRSRNQPMKAIPMNTEGGKPSNRRVKIEYDLSSTLLLESNTYDPYPQSYATMSKSSLTTKSQSIGLSTLPNRFYQPTHTPTELTEEPIYSNPEPKRKSLSNITAFDTKSFHGEYGNTAPINFFSGKFDSLPTRYRPGPLSMTSLNDIARKKNSLPRPPPPPLPENYGNDTKQLSTEDIKEDKPTVKKSTDNLYSKKSSTMVFRKLGNSISKKFNSLGRGNLKERKSVGSVFDLRSDSEPFEVKKSGSYSDLSFAQESPSVNHPYNSKTSNNNIDPWFHVANQSHESIAHLSATNPLFIPEDDNPANSRPLFANNNNKSKMLTQTDKPTVTEEIFGQDECISYL